MSLNQCTFIGRLGADPELRFIQSGKAVCNFSVAVDSVWKDRDGEKQKHTEWVRVQVWGAQAENCAKYLAKGREVCVVGEMRTRTYDDKEGIKRYVTEIHARDVKFLSGGGLVVGLRAERAGDPVGDSPDPADRWADGDDSVPF